ncbi:MAG: uncharacterized protein A8A55_0992 [Amphiamblys sp. WSBS2006]|nr:MAG: uncharacterized protein A8A55_0992 [Amphiamblys sp. WSBS2006]
MQTQRQFQKTFNTPENYLEYFHCAYRKNILIQGRLYITNTAVYFSASIFGTKTEISIPGNTIIAVLQRKTALLFHNAIKIVTITNSYTFTSFLNKKKAFLLLLDTFPLMSSPKKNTETHGEFYLVGKEKFSAKPPEEINKTHRNTIAKMFRILHEGPKDTFYCQHTDKTFFRLKTENRIEPNGMLTISNTTETVQAEKIVATEMKLELDLMEETAKVFESRKNKNTASSKLFCRMFFAELRRSKISLRFLLLASVFFLGAVAFRMLRRRHPRHPAFSRQVRRLEKETKRVYADVSVLFSSPMVDWSVGA